MSLPSWLTWPLRIVLALAIVAALHQIEGALPAMVKARLLNAYILDIIMLAGINIILAVSLNLINGITGQFSLGHAAFMAVGAYTAASFTRYAAPRLALPDFTLFPLALICGALAAGLAGLLVGLPSLRLRGDYLAIVTLGFGQIIVAIIVTVNEFGGALGLSDVKTNTTFSWLWAMVVLCILSIRNLANSGIGRDMRAVREDEIAAEAVGVNTTRTKVLAFVVSSMWAGIAGGLLAHYLPSFNPDSFNFVRSVEIVVMVVLGGLGSITGATLAAVLLKVMEEALRQVSGTMWVGICLIVLGALLFLPHRRPVSAWARWAAGIAGAGFALALLFRFGRHYIESPTTPGNAADWLRYVVYSLILIVLMLLRPQGLLGRAELSWAGLRRRCTARESEAAPQPAS